MPIKLSQQALINLGYELWASVRSCEALWGDRTHPHHLRYLENKQITPGSHHGLHRLLAKRLANPL
jgi:hypothetical protein